MIKGDLACVIIVVKTVDRIETGLGGEDEPNPGQSRFWSISRLFYQM